MPYRERWRLCKQISFCMRVQALTWNSLRENKFKWGKMALRQCRKTGTELKCEILFFGKSQCCGFPFLALLFLFFFSEWIKEGVGRFITVGEAAQLSLKTHGSILTIIFRITGTYSNGRTWQKMRFLNVLKHFKTLLLFMIIFMPVGAFRTHSILQWPHHPFQTTLVKKKIMSDLAAHHSCCFSSAEATLSFVTSLSQEYLWRELLPQVRESSRNSWDVQERASNLCWSTWGRKFRDQRKAEKSREKETDSTKCLELSYIVFQVFQEASGIETSNAVTFYFPKYSRGKIKMGSQHVILN